MIKEVINLTTVREFIEQGHWQESDYRYSRAKIWLQTQIKQNKNRSTEIFYLYARVLSTSISLIAR